MRMHVCAFAAVVAVGVASAPAIPAAFATGVTVPALTPASAQSVTLAIAAYESARVKYAGSLEVYLSHNRRSVQEYTAALRDYGTATKLLEVAKRDIAKTCSEDIKAATAIYNAAKRAAKTPEQKAAALATYNAAIATAASDREAATESLRVMPPAPPKVLKSKP